MKKLERESAMDSGPAFRLCYSEAFSISFCQGSGVARIGGADCPRCRGTGIRGYML